MATVINNPDNTGEGSGTGMVVGVLLAILIIVLFVLFAVPALRGVNRSGNTINVPDKVDVNVNPGTNGTAQ